MMYFFIQKVYKVILNSVPFHNTLFTSIVQSFPSAIFFTSESPIPKPFPDLAFSPW